jgi:SAM-dependent methyltransferase
MNLLKHLVGRKPAMDTPPIEKFKEYEYYHTIDLGEGVVTPGIEAFIPIQEPVIQTMHSIAFRGKRVLDIGCRDGLFCFEAEKAGAAEILGIDNDLSRAAVEFLIPFLHSKIKMREQNLYEFVVPEHGRFDIVIFSGVLYHLRLPFLGLKRVADATKPGGQVILETGALLSLAEHPLVYSPPPEQSPFDPTSVTFFNHAALVAALQTFGFDQIVCKNIQVWHPGGYANYPGWEAFLSGRDAHIGMSTAIIVGRAVYLCRLGENFVRDSAIQQYWYGYHQLNSVSKENQRFLGGYSKR